MFQDSSR